MTVRKSLRWALAVVLITLWWARTSPGQEIYQFTADWCGPCHEMDPMVAGLEREGIVVKRIDVDKSPGFAAQFGVKLGIPLFVGVDANKKPVGEIRGTTSADALRKLWAKANVKPITSNASNANAAIVRVSNTVGKGTSYGTGALVRKNLVLTCFHLVRDGVGTIQVTFPSGKTCSATMAGTDEARDLSALSIADASETPLQVCEQLPQAGQKLTTAGYGPEGQFAMRHGSLVQFVAYAKGEPQRGFQVSVGSLGGDSGGPVLDANGRIVGVLNSATSHETYATNCVEVCFFLRNGCPRIQQRLRARANGVKDAVLPGLANPQAQGGPPPRANPLPGPVDPLIEPDTLAPLAPQQPLAPIPPIPSGDPVEPVPSIVDKLKSDFAAEKAKLLADAEAKLQAAAEAHRNALGKQLGISDGLQAQINALATQGEQRAAEFLKQSKLATDLKSKAQQLEQKVADHVGTITENQATIGGLKSELAGLGTDLATNGGLLAAAQGKVAELLPLVESLKAGTTGLPWVAQGLIALTGLTPGVGVPLATALTVLGSLGAGWLAKGKIKKTAAGAVLGAATVAGQSAPQAIAAPAPMTASVQQSEPIIETQVSHSTQMVPYETNLRDRAWRDALGKVANRYPESAVWLTLVQKLRDDIVAAEPNPRGEIHAN